MVSMLAHEIFQYCQDLNKQHVGIGLEKHGRPPTMGESLGVELFRGELL